MVKAEYRPVGSGEGGHCACMILSTLVVYNTKLRWPSVDHFETLKGYGIDHMQKARSLGGVAMPVDILKPRKESGIKQILGQLMVRSVRLETDLKFAGSNFLKEWLDHSVLLF